MPTLHPYHGRQEAGTTTSMSRTVPSLVALVSLHTGHGVIST
jgi:hypothetical protein